MPRTYSIGVERPLLLMIAVKTKDKRKSCAMRLLFLTPSLFFTGWRALPNPVMFKIRCHCSFKCHSSLFCFQSWKRTGFLIVLFGRPLWAPSVLVLEAGRGGKSGPGSWAGIGNLTRGMLERGESPANGWGCFGVNSVNWGAVVKGHLDLGCRYSLKTCDWGFKDFLCFETGGIVTALCFAGWGIRGWLTRGTGVCDSGCGVPTGLAGACAGCRTGGEALTSCGLRKWRFRR